MMKLLVPFGRLTSCVTTLLEEIRGVPLDSNPRRLLLLREIRKRVSSRLTDAFSIFIENPKLVNFSVC